jgi:hypothetical protein
MDGERLSESRVTDTVPTAAFISRNEPTHSASIFVLRMLSGACAGVFTIGSFR